MGMIIAIWTVVKPMLWISFFFTYITIIFPRIIFKYMTESERMLTYLVVCDSVLHLKSSANSQAVQRNTWYLPKSQLLQLWSYVVMERLRRYLWPSWIRVSKNKLQWTSRSYWTSHDCRWSHCNASDKPHKTTYIYKVLFWRVSVTFS